MKTIAKLILMAGLLVGTTYAYCANPVKVMVSQDAFVQGGNTSGEPLGMTKSDRLRVGKSFGTDKYSRITYLQFNLKKVEEINDVTLHVCARIYESKEDASASFILDVMGAESNKWSESSIKFDKKPEATELLATAEYAPVNDNTWIEVKIPADKLKSLMDKKGKVTLVLYNSDFNKTSMEIISKERCWSNGSPAKREAFLKIK